jgi:hypothetical protein
MAPRRRRLGRLRAVERDSRYALGDTPGAKDTLRSQRTEGFSHTLTVPVLGYQRCEAHRDLATPAGGRALSINQPLRVQGLYVANRGASSPYVRSEGGPGACTPSPVGTRGLRGLRVQCRNSRVPEVSPTVAARFVGMSQTAAHRHAARHLSVPTVADARGPPTRHPAPGPYTWRAAICLVPAAPPTWRHEPRDVRRGLPTLSVARQWVAGSPRGSRRLFFQGTC